MNKTIAKISNIDLFNINSALTGECSFGGNQSWYPTKWQQESGCGPTTASNMFYYISEINTQTQEKPSNRPIPRTKEGMLALMNDVWEYVTPTKTGVSSTQLFIDGSKKYALSKGIKLACHSIDIPAAPFRGVVNFHDFISVIREGLEAGYPLAFLNLSNGKLDNLHHWHWVTLMSLEQDETGNYFCLASDAGKRKTINIKLWFDTTVLGGGIVSFSI